MPFPVIIENADPKNNSEYASPVVIVDGLGRSDSASSHTLSSPLAHFEREVLSSYGDVVSIIAKAKGLNKFGQNVDVDTALETVWYPGGNEVYATSNVINTISSTVAGDLVPMTVEGHTISGTGVDAQFTFVVQTATLNGQNKVVLTTPVARVSRFYNNGTVDITGDIYVYEDDTVVGGVPQTPAKIHGQIPAGQQQTFKAATTFSNTDYFALSHFQASMTKGGPSGTADFILEVREVGKSFRPRFIMTCSDTSGLAEQVFDPPLIVPKNADVRIRAIGSVANIPVNAAFEGYVALVVV